MALDQARAHGIGTEAIDDVVRVDRVLLRFGHLDDPADLDRKAVFLENRAVAATLDFGRTEIRLPPVFRRTA